MGKEQRNQEEAGIGQAEAPASDSWRSLVPALLKTLAFLLVGVAIFYMLWFSQRSERLDQGRERSLQVFTEQTEAVFTNVLHVFGTTTRNASLPDLLAAHDSGILSVRGRSVEATNTGAAPSPGQGKPGCSLELALVDGKARLELTFEGLVSNREGAWELSRLVLASDITGQLEPYAKTKGFDTLLLASESGEVFLHVGAEETRVDHLESLLAEAQDGPGEDGKKPAGKLGKAGPRHFDPSGRYRVFERELQVKSAVLEQMSNPVFQGCAQQAFRLRAVGLVEKWSLGREGLQVPQGPLIGLCFALLLGLVGLPFLNLFTLAPGQHVRRMDAALLMLCAVLLAATVTIGFLFASAASAVRQEEVRQLEELHGRITESFTTELGKITEQLDQAASLLPGPAESAAPGRLGLAELQQCDSLAYPNFDLAFFADDTGIRDQVPTACEPGSLPDIRERRYFRALDDDSACEGVREGEATSLLPEPIHSWATGERATVFARRVCPAVTSAAPAGPSPSPRRVASAPLADPAPPPEALHATAAAASTPATASPRHYPIEALMARTLSLERALLPEGLGFAVVDADGEVLYHSESWRAGFENLITECGSSPQLRSLLGVDSAASSFVGDCEGRAVRLRVAPFDSRRGWWLATFSDQEPVRAMRLQLALFGVLAMTAYLLLLALLVTLELMLSPRLRAQAYWPHGERGRLYTWLALSYLLLALAFVPVVASSSPGTAVLLGLIVPAGTLVGSIVVLALRVGDPARWRPAFSPQGGTWLLGAVAAAALVWAIASMFRDLPALALVAAVPLMLTLTFLSPWPARAKDPGRGMAALLHRTALTLLVLSLGALPAYAFYSAAFHREAQLAVESALRRWLDDSGAQKKEINGRFRACKAERGEASDGRRVDWKSLREEARRQAGKLSDYGAVRGIKAAVREPSASSEPPWFDAVYSWVRPLYNDFSKRTYAYLSPADPKVAHVGCTAAGDYVLCSQSRTEERGLSRAAQASTIGLGWRSLTGGSLAGLALALSLGGALWLVGAAAGRLFAAELSPRMSSPEGLRRRRILWIGPPGEWVLEKLAKPEGVRTLTLAAARVPDALTGAGSASVSTLLVPNFGSGLASERREVLLGLTGWQGGVWLVSHVAQEELEALDRAISREGESAESGPSLAELLEGFEVLHGRGSRDEMRGLARRSAEVAWRTLTREEKQVLVRLTRGPFVERNLWPALRSLVAYGLVDAERAPRIVVPELAELASEKEPEIEPPGRGTRARASMLARIRPILWPLLACLVVLLFTQEGAFKLLATAIATLAGVLEGLSRLGDFLFQPRTSGES